MRELPSSAARTLSRARESAAALVQRAVAWVRLHPWRAVAIPPAALLAYVLVLVPFTPGIDDLRKAKSEVPAIVMASDGAVLAQYRRVHREWVPLDRISPNVIDALIATEDRRFYEHHGIDWRRTLAAAFSTLGGDRQGGSTITQQLARNMFPDDIGRAPTVTRKIKEAITALKIESVYSKDEILETYLNTVPFLYNAFGIEMAARTYFDTSAGRLDVLQAATLIGMLKGTSYYNPVLNPERAVDRRNIVLAQMAKYGKLDPSRLASLTKRPLRLDFEKQEEPVGIAPHVAQQIRKWLIDWADRKGYDIYSDGLVVRTTIHSRLQKAANAAVARQVAALQPLADRSRRRGEDRPKLQAGFLAIDPRNGYVRAWVGSPDFATEPFDHVVQARRQPGSTFKPFVYAAAFEHGFTPDSTFLDQPVSIRGRGGEVWSPTDPEPPTGRPVTLRDGLVFSRNRITAQLMDRVGAARVAELARALGVRQSKLDVVPSLALGTSPVTLKEMVTAYATLADGGGYIEPTLVTRIENRKGEVLESFEVAKPQPVLPRATALKLVDVMRGVVDEGTATAIRTRWGIQADVAGKTGTTQDDTDGWFILMHPQLVAGAWVGFDDSSITMGERWGQGARSALPIVGNVVAQSLRYGWIDPREEFDIPRRYPRRRHEEPVQEFVNDLLDRLFRLLQ
jgi:penicillin-binding protein 1A